MASHCFPLSCLTIFRDRTIFDGMTLKNDLQTTTQVQSRAGPCVSLHRAQHDPRSWRSPQKPRPTPSCLLRTTSTLIPLHPRTYTWIIRRQFCVLQPRSIRLGPGQQGTKASDQGQKTEPFFKMNIIC